MIKAQRILCLVFTLTIIVSAAYATRPERQNTWSLALEQKEQKMSFERSRSERWRRSPHTARSALRGERELDLESGIMAHDEHEDGRRQLVRYGNNRKTDNEHDLKGGVMVLDTPARQSHRRNDRNDADPEGDLVGGLMQQDKNRQRYHQSQLGKADDQEADLTGGIMQHNSPRMRHLRSAIIEGREKHKIHFLAKRHDESMSHSERRFLEEKQSDAERKLHSTPVDQTGHRRRRDQGMLTGLGEAQKGVDVRGLTNEERHKLEEKSTKRRKRNSSKFRMGRSVYQEPGLGLGGGYKSADVQGLTNGERQNLEEQDERDEKAGTITMEASKKRLGQAQALDGDGTLSEEDKEISVGEDGISNQHMLTRGQHGETENLSTFYSELNRRHHHTVKKQIPATKPRSLYQTKDGKIESGANLPDEHTRMVSEHLSEKRRHQKREAVSRKLIQAESGWFEVNGDGENDENIRRFSQMARSKSSKQKRGSGGYGTGVLYDAGNGKIEGGTNAQDEHTRMVSEHLSERRRSKVRRDVHRKEAFNFDFLDHTGGTEDEHMSESNLERHPTALVLSNNADTTEAKKEHDGHRQIRDAPVRSVGTKLVLESGDLSADPKVPSGSHHPVNKRDSTNDGVKHTTQLPLSRVPDASKSHIDDDLIEDILHLEGFY